MYMHVVLCVHHVSHMFTAQYQMDSTPHYGKLDHGVRKGTTLPGTVIPPTGDEYGKLDQVCTCTTKYMYIILYMYINCYNSSLHV